MKNISIKEWIENFDKGTYSKRSTDVQIEAGWYDWFCKDTSLAGKTKVLGPKLKKIAKSNLIDIDKQYVFFKNNCPCFGSLYDSFSICDIETGNVIFWVAPSLGYSNSKGKSQVSGKSNNFEEPLVEGTWEDVLKYFNV